MEGHKKKLQHDMVVADYLNWVNGQYFLSALGVALDGFSKHPNAKYIENPVLSEDVSNKDSEELEMEREIFNMERWIANDTQRGLPQTEIIL